MITGCCVILFYFIVKRSDKLARMVELYRTKRCYAYTQSRDDASTLAAFKAEKRAKRLRLIAAAILIQLADIIRLTSECFNPDTATRNEILERCRLLSMDADTTAFCLWAFVDHKSGKELAELAGVEPASAERKKTRLRKRLLSIK